MHQNNTCLIVLPVASYENNFGLKDVYINFLWISAAIWVNKSMLPIYTVRIFDRIGSFRARDLLPNPTWELRAAHVPRDVRDPLKRWNRVKVRLFELSQSIEVNVYVQSGAWSFITVHHHSCEHVTNIKLNCTQHHFSHWTIHHYSCWEKIIGSSEDHLSIIGDLVRDADNFLNGFQL